MKKSRVIILTMFVLVIFLLTSCVIPTYSKRINKMIPGYFEGYDISGQDIDARDYEPDYSTLCTLTVKEITEEEFNEANGINTVYDEVGEKYYYILFTSKKNDEETIIYEFYNMRDAYNGSLDTPISYYDSNHYWLSPNIGGTEFSEEANYRVHIPNYKGVEIFTYLYFKGEVNE